MPDHVSYLHVFKAGDLITILPGLKHIYDTTGVKAVIYQRLGMPSYYEGSDEQCMTLSTFQMLRPLIESQDYIAGFFAWEGEKCDMDLTASRNSEIVGLPNGSIHHWTWMIAPELQCNLSIPWIDVEPNNDLMFGRSIIINRTTRYRNPYITYFFLKEYQDHLIFTGLESEYNDFCQEFKLNLAYLKPDNFLELSRIIKGCRFFLGNQSFCFHLADAQKVERLLECSTTYPNTFPTGQGGYVFLHQKSLEMQFKRMFNESIR